MGFCIPKKHIIRHFFKDLKTRFDFQSLPVFSLNFGLGAPLLHFGLAAPYLSHNI
jgi:hypothetical protein